jgi:hypothetical protein
LISILVCANTRPVFFAGTETRQGNNSYNNN